jgi:ureidoglycolate lyase
MILIAQPLSADAFAPFGDVLQVGGAARSINAGLCLRYHDRAQIDIQDGHAGISIFHAQLRALPYHFDLIERHPLGSQAFIPMSDDPFLVIAALNNQAVPQAFVTNGAQGINFHRGTWHGVLTPLAGNGLFAVIDRIGEGANLEEFRHPTGWTVMRA